MARVLQMMAETASIPLCMPARAEAPEGRLQASPDAFQAECGFLCAAPALIHGGATLIPAGSHLANSEAGFLLPGLVSTSYDLAVWGHALFGRTGMPVPNLAGLPKGSPAAPDVHYRAGAATHSDTARGPVHGGVLGDGTRLRHDPERGVTIAFQINTVVGAADDSMHMGRGVEAGLAQLAMRLVGEGAQ